MKNTITYILFLFGCLTATIWAQAQSINLDQPFKAGELTLFPDINDASVYYYISDKPHLATDANGRPQFSFLRYVDNSLSSEGQQQNQEGDGGGIVHAVVSLSITQEQLREAQRALQRIKPNAVIQGPVIYKSGRFGLISSFKDPQGGLVRQVLGLSGAPLLDNEKAAVSIQLNKQGAKILWESFKTPTPDISFTFEMEISGYRAPKKATIEANFDQIYDHKAFAAGLATKYLAAEIKGAFDDLVRSGAIKLVQVGEDEKLDALITTAYNKISDMMFAPLNGSGAPGVADLAANGQNTSLLDRATTMLRENRSEAQRNNREAEDRRTATSGNTTTSGNNSTGAAVNSGTPAPASPSTSGTSTSASESGTNRPAASYGQTQPAGAGTHAAVARPDDAPTPATTGNQTESVPGFALMATYEMKRIHQQGIFKIDLNKSTADNITTRFDENIGDLTSYMNDDKVFREVNIGSPLFVQREVMALIDGMNAQDFGQYINSVNVRMVKNHQSGDITQQEVHIDRQNFNKEGNSFRMLYGYHGDNDRKKWMDYEYETEWSFFGGQTVKVPLMKSTSGVINLSPPYQRRSVEFQADNSHLAGTDVRSIIVKLYYDLGGKEQMKQISLDPAKGHLSEKIEFMLPSDQFDYEYEVIWKLNNNTEQSSGRLKSNDAIQFVDNIKS